MVFNATFNNISATSWRSILLVEETGVPGKNHQLVSALKTSEEKSQKAYDAWAEKFKKKNGKDPGSKDRYINTIYSIL
jgi:hypothetical protein